MGLISKEVEVTLVGKYIKYYEELGYEIPRHVDSRRRITVPKNSKIFVKATDLPEHSNTKVFVQCDCGEYCDREIIQVAYTTYTKNTQKHNGKFFCRKCVMPRGEAHVNWNPELTDEEREVRRGYPEYNEFSRRVLKRDRYTCQCCGKTKGKMQVHHLNSYDWCAEGRTDVKNGITLCPECHSNFHCNPRGRGNNTKEQFEEWLGRTIKLLDDDIEVSSCRKIFCIEENKIYDGGAPQIVKEWGLAGDIHIYRVCNHIEKAVKGKHLLWLDEYEKMSEQDIQNYKTGFNRKGTRIICFNTGMIYPSIIAFCREYHHSYDWYRDQIRHSGHKYVCDRTPEEGPIVAMDYKDFLSLTDKEIKDLSDKFNLSNLQELFLQNQGGI